MSGPDAADLEGPYTEYARLRHERPVARVRQPNGLETFVVTRYADARKALADPRLSKDARVAEAALAAAGITTWRRDGTGFSHNMLTTDPPEHTRLRRLVSAEFTPRRIEALRPRIQEIVDGLLAAMLPAGSADLIAAFAFQVPMMVISDLLGVPFEDREEFRRWTADAVTPTGDPRQLTGLAALNRYLTGLVRAKRDMPGDDLLSALISARDEDRLTEDELIGTAVLLLIAGHDTTVNLIGNGTLAVLRDPGQLRLLRERPELLPAAIEEFLRYEPPVDQATTRFAAADLEIAGVPIPKGSVVRVAIGSANRDEEQFGAADRLDVTRKGGHHLGFGHGIHYCLGAPLARIEAQIALDTLLRRCATLELAVPETELRWREGPLIRGLEALPLTFVVA